ncbi:zinc finger protein-domain-containing protein [Ilyonectria robusta]|uniref:zinc finger protein-domain-containing protein n=1 Tax=Ilyonectria robusta TaxID=1079257 RepID=UPI001E8D3C5A|nr:zinc finger protein-domain-containing protein [Ilyonectria robusta]KAH8688198.1 zinc finger protein-domain-containing protein [Ilyonectria robusta]
MHRLIAETFENCGITQIEIPKCHGFIPRSHKQFWDNNLDLTNAAKDICNLPAHALYAERILPLPKTTRTLLIEKFCPRKVKTEAFNAVSNKDCLVRVYLGSLNGRSINRFFNLRNLKLYLNHMIELKMAVAGIASDMATALAAMHWAAKTDARDVEFVLGSSTKPLSGITTSEIAALPPNSLAGPQSGNLEDFHYQSTALWLLDFNQVRRITMDEAGVAMAVESFLLNDPYYPRPFQQIPVAKALWNIFVQKYLEESSGHLREESGDVRQLPGLFLSGVMEAERKKLVDDSA